MAAGLTKALGRPVRYNDVSPEVSRSFGFLGADDMDNMFQFNRDSSDGSCRARSIDATRSLNPALKSFDTWLSENKGPIPLESRYPVAGGFRPMMRPMMAAALVLGAAVTAEVSWNLQASGTTERLRGVSAASDTVAWASGNNGTVVRTVDGGRTWNRIAVPDGESLDFRDIEAFDADTACILSIGPGDASRIFRTADGGTTWTRQFTNPDPKAFYDAMAFWDAKTGVAVGDPVDGRFTVIRTVDGGRSWAPVRAASLPPALDGDGAFAASGTCLVVHGTRYAWFGTGGGARARVFRSTDQGLTWDVAETPIMAGTASAGIFSLAFADADHGMAVGGDYRHEREPGDNLAVTNDGGRTWAFAGLTRLRSFRSAIGYVPGTKGRRLIAVGPAGSDSSVDGGATWTPISDEGFHALSLAPQGGAAWAVGEQGRIGVARGLVR